MKPRAGRLALALVAIAACSQGNSLEGSLSDETSLSFDSVQVQVSSSAVAVIYLRNLPGGGGQDTVLKVVATTTGLDLTRPLSIDLTEPLNGGPAVRGSVSRAVSGDARNTFAALVRGRLELDDPPTVGGPMSGSFTVLFGQGGTIGDGRTAFGNFYGKVAQAGQ